MPFVAEYNVPSFTILIPSVSGGGGGGGGQGRETTQIIVQYTYHSYSTLCACIVA